MTINVPESNNVSVMNYAPPSSNMINWTYQPSWQHFQQPYYPAYPQYWPQPCNHCPTCGVARPTPWYVTTTTGTTTGTTTAGEPISGAVRTSLHIAEDLRTDVECPAGREYRPSDDIAVESDTCAHD